MPAHDSDAPLPLIVSRLIAVPHGFTTRAGGASGGPFSSLNLALNVGDAPQTVNENLRRVVLSVGTDPGALALVSQVHGDAVVEAPVPSGSDAVKPPGTEADAVWTQRPGQAVGVRVADCVPLLLHDVKTGRVGAVHAGWRGARARIAQKAIFAWRDAGTRPEDVRAAIGPCIRACCFEVDDALAQAFAADFGPPAVTTRGARRHVDLVFAVTASLRAAGLGEAQIDVVGSCTACHPEQFFSHRRDRGVTGRHLGLIRCGQ